LGDISALSDEDLDALLLAQCKPRLQKVAMVIGLAMSPYENWDEQRVGDRIAALVKAGKIVSEGHIHEWRHSEIRLPDTPHA
jgi:major membrane immunogen (membrane-anchored lipoprotein)